MAMIKNLAELKARGELHQDDIVVFMVGSATFEYDVYSDHLSYEPGDNGIIFDKLGVNAEEFCSQAYGYEHEGGFWPESHSDDFAALTRAVEAIYIEIARQELRLPKTEPSLVSMTKIRTPGQPALISSVADVDAYAPLQVGDRIFFQKDGEELSLQVNKDHDGYLCGRGCSERGTSGQVFDHVLRGQSRKGFAREATGKAPSSGSYDWWPQYREVEDFQKLLKALLTAYGQTGETEVAAGLNEGDKFKLTVKKETLKYTVEEHDDQFFGCLYNPAEERNSHVFDLLGVHPGAFIEEVTGVHARDYDAANQWPDVPTLADFNKVVQALRERCAAADAGSRTITTVEELRAALPLRVDDKFVIQSKTLEIRKDSDGWYGYFVGYLEQKVFRDLGIENAEGYVEGLLGYTPGDFGWPEVHTAEDLAKVIEDLMIRAGQGGVLYREGDVVRNTRGLYRRILDVIDSGKRFFLSDSHGRSEYLDSDPAPRFGGVEVTLEELKRDYTRVVPETPAAPAAEEHRFTEGDMLYDPEDEDYARILAASSDGNVFALSQWTTDRSDEDKLSTPEVVWTLEEIKECNLILAPTEEPKKVLHLTRGQIAEKFGVDPDQLEIHDEAA